MILSLRGRAVAMLGMAAIATVLASDISFASRESDDHAPDPFAAYDVDARALVHEAQAEVAAGNCATAWNLLWPSFRDGQPFAATALASFVIYDGLVPPGSSADPLSQERHAAILAINGLDQDNLYALELLDTLQKPSTYRRTESWAASECATDPRLCRLNLIKNRQIPNPENYAEEIELLTRTTGVDARCLHGLAMHAEP